MQSDLKIFVCRAADEFRAADRAQHPKAAAAHSQLAIEYVDLIKCDGDMHIYRMLKKRREGVVQDGPSAPVLTLVDAA